MPTNGKIDIPIKRGRQIIGTLRLDDVLIVPSLDRRLFSVNSFLTKGNRRVLFQDDYVAKCHKLMPGTDSGVIKRNVYT